jgi:predicted transcriptional regulator
MWRVPLLFKRMENIMSKLDDIHFGGGVKAFFDLPIFGRSRNSDPVTSHQAAAQVTTTSNHFQIILDALHKHGSMGKDEIAQKTGLEPNAVARRLPELQKLALVELTGKNVRSKANRLEREWKAC